jgi:transcriptional regulator with GAF, ATPase, and Fis domain
MTTASYDFRYNYKALLLAIVAPQYITPDKAIGAVGMTHDRTQDRSTTKQTTNYSDQDLEEVLRLRDQGVTWNKAGELLGVDPKTLFNAVKRYKNRRNIA